MVLDANFTQSIVSITEFVCSITAYFVATINVIKVLNKKWLCLALLCACFSSISTAQVIPLPFDNYFSKRKGLQHTVQAITQHKHATVAFLGGSITYNGGWRDMVCAYLKERFPDTKFHFIAAGIPSLGSLPHAFRVSRDVLDSGRIDLLFLEAAVNDQVNGTDSITQVRSLEGIVRHVKKANPQTDILLMSFADPDKTKLYDEGLVPTAVANHELVATYYGLPSINLAKAVHDKMRNQEFSWEKDFKDLHPSPFGQQIYFSAIKILLDSSLTPAVSKYKAGKLPKMLNRASFINGKYYGPEHAVYDQNWTLDRSWSPEDKLPTRPGFVQVPMLVSSKAGASLSLKFSGNTVGINIVSGADAGILEYRIDNGHEQQINLFTPWSTSLHIPWYLILGSDLGLGEHTLSLKISDQKDPKSNGNTCRIVNFLINN